MQSTIEFIKEKIGDYQPKIALILGSGLGSFADNYDGVRIKYEDIPGFEKSHVEGHKGQLVFAEIEGKKTVIMQGRYHYYEGYEIDKVVFPIKVFKHLGVKNLIITNAAGAVHNAFKPGDLMIITEHINMTGVDPLRGSNDAVLGTRFPDMSEVYKKHLVQIAEQAAFELYMPIQKGVYCWRSGPCYETCAEIRMIHRLGADAVGMSTVPEAVTANYCGINVLGISCLTNYAAGISDKPLAHAEVIETAAKVQQDFQKLLLNIIKKM